jgi:hypothetical protein
VKSILILFLHRLHNFQIAARYSTYSTTCILRRVMLFDLYNLILIHLETVLRMYEGLFEYPEETMLRQLGTKTARHGS